MIQSISTAKRAAIGIFMGIVLFAMSVPSAQAQTYYYTTASPTYNNNAQIQNLINQLVALIAQLQALQGNKVPIYDHSKGQYSNKNYDVEVETEDADVESDDTVVLEGDLDLDDAPYANVWFEYGQNGRLTEESESLKLTSSRTFSIEVDDLDEDEQYYFRAVSEDPAGQQAYGSIKGFFTNEDGYDDDDDDHNDGDTPEAETDDAEDIDENSAELHGKVWMNNFEDGIAFFVYGEDEDLVEEVEDESRYSNIDEDGDDLRKVQIYSNVDDDRSFWLMVSGLNDDTDHYFRICVQYEDEDNDDTLECGDVESFTTDN